VAAIVQPRPGREPTLEDLVAHCRTVIAGYKVPRQLHLVDAIGRTPSGKADYRWAKEQVSSPFFGSLPTRAVAERPKNEGTGVAGP
jgi:3-oxocholest-4-en-26-oate---CoA ligase